MASVHGVPARVYREIDEKMPKAGGKFTGFVGVLAASAAAAGIYFGDDIDTGFFSPGENQVSITTGGIEAVRVDENGHLSLYAGDPVNDNHAATKKYVDDVAGSGVTQAYVDTGDAANNTYADNAANTAESNANAYTDSQIGPGIAVAWASVTAGGSANDSYGVSSVSNTGTGQYTVTLNEAVNGQAACVAAVNESGSVASCSIASGASTMSVSILDLPPGGLLISPAASPANRAFSVSVFDS